MHILKQPAQTAFNGEQMPGAFKAASMSAINARFTARGASGTTNAIACPNGLFGTILPSNVSPLAGLTAQPASSKAQMPGAFKAASMSAINARFTARGASGTTNAIACPNGLFGTILPSNVYMFRHHHAPIQECFSSLTVLYMKRRITLVATEY